MAEHKLHRTEVKVGVSLNNHVEKQNKTEQIKKLKQKKREKEKHKSPSNCMNAIVYWKIFKGIDSLKIRKNKFKKTLKREIN